MKKILATISVVFLLFVVFFYSCTKEVNIEIPKIEKKAIIYGLIGNNEQIKIWYGKSYGILDYVENNEISNDSAEISLFVNDNFIEKLLFNEDNYFSSDYLPKPNDNIDIIVTTVNDDTLTAHTLVPEPVIINYVLFEDSAFIDEEGISFSRISVSFNDNPNQENYYEMYFCARCHTDTTEVFLNVYEYSSFNPIILNEDILDYEPKTIVFSDILFQGDTTEISVSFVRPCLYLYGQPSVCEFDLIIYCLSISKEYYLYRKTLYKHLFSQQTNIWDGAIEPVQMYSNINGGYGVFAGYSLYVDTIYSNNK